MTSRPIDHRPAVLFYCQHSLGLGHLARAMRLAEGLTERCRHYIEGIRAAYKSEPLPQAPPVMPIAYVK